MKAQTLQLFVHRFSTDMEYVLELFVRVFFGSQ